MGDACAHSATNTPLGHQGATTAGAGSGAGTATELGDVTVRAFPDISTQPPGSAAYDAPTGDFLDAGQPNSVVSQRLIERNVIPMQSYDHIRYSPSVQTVEPVGPGLQPNFHQTRRDQNRPEILSTRQSRQTGFTLLEVMVALAIAVPALLLLYRQGGLALEVTRSAASYDQAISRAQSRLDALVETALATGDREGDDGGGFRWRTRIVPITTMPAPRGGPPRSAFAGGTTLYAVSVAISWSGGDRARSVALQTRRLGPAQGESP